MLQLLRREREYIQLHRDTSVSSLTLAPSLEGGVLVWEDSPLVRAMKFGRVLMIDEADKAPTEVVVVLKALLADGDILLADGRRFLSLSSFSSMMEASDEKDNEGSVEAAQKCLSIHPNFRVIALANRPGFPFLGNDFFAEMGDVFSCFAVDNPDQDAEVTLLKSYGPDVPIELLQQLSAAFSDLRLLADEGQLSYPYSTRELVHIVRHLQAFPLDDVSQVMRNVFDFDSFDPSLLQTLSEIFTRQGLPFDDVLGIELSNSPADGESEQQDSLAGDDREEEEEEDEEDDGHDDDNIKSLSSRKKKRIQRNRKRVVLAAETPLPNLKIKGRMILQQDNEYIVRSYQSTNPLRVALFYPPDYDLPEPPQVVPREQPIDWKPLQREHRLFTRGGVFTEQTSHFQLIRNIDGVPVASAALPPSIDDQDFLPKGGVLILSTGPFCLHLFDFSQGSLRYISIFLTRHLLRYWPKDFFEPDPQLFIPPFIPSLLVGPSERSSHWKMVRNNRLVFIAQQHFGVLMAVDLRSRDVRVFDISSTDEERTTTQPSQLYFSCQRTPQFAFLESEGWQEIPSQNPSHTFLFDTFFFLRPSTRLSHLRFLLVMKQAESTSLFEDDNSLSITICSVDFSKQITIEQVVMMENSPSQLPEMKEPIVTKTTGLILTVNQGKQQHFLSVQAPLHQPMSIYLTPLFRAFDAATEQQQIQISGKSPAIPSHEWAALHSVALAFDKDSSESLRIMPKTPHSASSQSLCFVCSNDCGQDDLLASVFISESSTIQHSIQQRLNSRKGFSSTRNPPLFLYGVVPRVQINEESFEISKSINPFNESDGQIITIGKVVSKKTLWLKQSSYLVTALLLQDKRLVVEVIDFFNHKFRSITLQSASLTGLPSFSEPQTLSSLVELHNGLLMIVQRNGHVRFLELRPLVLSSQLSSWQQLSRSQKRALGRQRRRNKAENAGEGVITSEGGVGSGEGDGEGSGDGGGGGSGSGGGGGSGSGGDGSIMNDFEFNLDQKLKKLSLSKRDKEEGSEEQKLRETRKILDETVRQAKAASVKQLSEDNRAGISSSLYEKLFQVVSTEISQLRMVLESVEAKERERVWMKNQSQGELDDNRLVDGATGEKSIFKRRANEDPMFGSHIQKKPKRLRFVMDVSSSMSHFNSSDRRLDRMAATTIMIMESFVGFEHKYDYSIIGQDGESPLIPFVNFGNPPKTAEGRLKVIDMMYWNAMFCLSGDHTLAAAHLAIEEVVKEEADDYFVFVLSDANLRSYGINDKVLASVLLADPRVNTFALFIAGLDDAEGLLKSLPFGRGFVCTDTTRLPRIFKDIFTTSLLNSNRNPRL